MAFPTLELARAAWRDLLRAAAGIGDSIEVRNAGGDAGRQGRVVLAGRFRPERRRDVLVILARYSGVVVVDLPVARATIAV